MNGSSFRHDALFYDTEETFAAALVPFLRDGVEQGQGAVAVTSPARISLLRDALGSQAPAVSFIEADEWYVRPAATIASWHRALRDLEAQGFAYSRIVGEVRFGVTDADHQSWTRYEAALNGAFWDAAAWIVCPYDSTCLPEPVVAHARRTHPVVWDHQPRSSDAYVDPRLLLSELPEPLPRPDGAPALRLTVDGGLAEVRRSVRDAVDQGVLSPRRVDDLLLVLNEVLANALRHGTPPATVTLWVGADHVVCEVADQGPGVPDPLAGYVPPAPESAGGMGLWVAHQLVERLALRGENGQATVRFLIRG